jgi:hypothetical protein
VSPSNHPYRPHITNGGGKPSNWLWPVCLLNWKEGGAGNMVKAWPEELGRWWKPDPETSQTFHGYSGRIRERLENIRQPLPGHGYGGSSRPPCGYSCTLYAESFESLKSFGTELVVLSSIPIVVLEIRLVYGTHYDIDHLIMFTSFLYWILCAFMQIYKCLLIPFASTKYLCRN